MEQVSSAQQQDRTNASFCFWCTAQSTETLETPRRLSTWEHSHGGSFLNVGDTTLVSHTVAVAAVWRMELQPMFGGRRSPTERKRSSGVESLCRSEKRGRLDESDEEFAILRELCAGCVH